MIKIEGLVGVVVFVLWVYCLVEVISTPEHRMRHLPKIAWVVIVLLFPFVGSIVWLAVGRPEGSPRRSAYEREVAAYPEYDRRGRMAAADPEKDDAFLAQVRERAEAQRKAYEAKKRQDPGPPAAAD